VLNSSKIDHFISFLTVFIQLCSDMAYPSELVICVSCIDLIIYIFFDFSSFSTTFRRDTFLPLLFV
jgi:hypothetical protein